MYQQPSTIYAAGMGPEGIPSELTWSPGDLSIVELVLPVSMSKSLLSREPWPCDPAAVASDSVFSKLTSQLVLSGGVFFQHQCVLLAVSFAVMCRMVCIYVLARLSIGHGRPARTSRHKGDVYT